MLALALTLVVAAEPMKFDPNQNVQRHPDGGLWVGIASEKQTVRGVPIPKDSAVEFDESGGLTFHPNGMISSVTNDWGVGFYDEQGKHLRHKEYAK